MKAIWTIGGLLVALCVAQQCSWADDKPGLHNVRHATDSILVGSEPEGEEAFRSLQSLGVRAILSVDGATPNLELARKYGMRYIHIPIGYDGIDQQSALAMTRVARDIRGPLYVHCHHGRHRGPAAAAVVCLAAGVMTHGQTEALMTTAGTSRDYVGLWRDVAAFRVPGPEVKLPELQEVAKVDSVAASMAKLDRHFEQVKLVSKAGWKVPAEHPDLIPVTEALLVEEGLRETFRQLDSKQADAYGGLLQESVVQAGDLTKAVRQGQWEQAGAALMRLEKSCAKCHAEFRN
jgi:hypothetical protein